MEGTVIERAPQAHCHRCDSTEIVGVCSHCQQLMCQPHLPFKPSRLARWVGRLLYRLRIVDQPYDGSVVLCQDCYVRPMLPLLTLIVLLALAHIGVGGWILVQGDPWGVAVIGIGLLWLGVLWFAPRRLEGKNFRQRRTTIHVTPRVDKRQIQEWARGHIVLDECGDYQVTETSAEGRMTLDFSFSETDQKRVDSFLKKQRKAKRGQLKYHAGFIVLKGWVSNWPMVSPAFHVKPLVGPVVALEDKIANASFLTSQEGREARQWEALYGYSLFRNLEAKTFPVQVLPAIRPDTEQRVLDLTVQWLNPFPGAVPIEAHQIDLMRVRVPLNWGSIEYASGGYKLETDPWHQEGDDPIRVLTWERVPLSRRNQEAIYRVFTVKFERPIQLTDSIRGDVRVKFRNSLSGVTGIEYFTSGGKLSLLDEGVNIATIAEAYYDISLATLRYQKTLVFPNLQPAMPGHAGNGEPTDYISRQEETLDYSSLAPQVVTPRIAAIAPNAETVVQLTNALSDAGFYIQWTVENRPHTGAAAGVTNRYWDIGGRYYQGVNPIDFHLMITGEQTNDQSAPDGRKTMVSLSVKGAYVTDVMKHEIINVWIRLDDVVEKTLRALEQLSTEEGTYWAFDAERLAMNASPSAWHPAS